MHCRLLALLDFLSTVYHVVSGSGGVRQSGYIGTLLAVPLATEPRYTSTITFPNHSPVRIRRDKLDQNRESHQEDEGDTERHEDVLSREDRGVLRSPCCHRKPWGGATFTTCTRVTMPFLRLHNHGVRTRSLRHRDVYYNTYFVPESAVIELISYYEHMEEK